MIIAKKIQVFQYAFIVAASLLILFSMEDIDFQGSVFFHTLMESLATILAFAIGVLALIRFYGRADHRYLYIGAGFVGTAFLDGYHALVTSSFFLGIMPTEYSSLVPWSWSASRFFLAFLLLLDALFIFGQTKKYKYLFPPKTVFVFTFAITVLFVYLFAFFPLPDISAKESIIARPIDLVVGFIFLLSLILHLINKRWMSHSFDHWMILFLLVSVITQIGFMSSSEQVNDTAFNLAHLLKKLSYFIILIGLLISLYRSYRALTIELLHSKELELVVGEKMKLHQESEKRFRAIADFTSGWEVWHSPNGVIIYTNPASVEFTGYTVEDFLTRKINMLQLLAPEQADEIIDHFATISVTDGIGDIEFLIEKKDGAEVWISQKFQSTFDEFGNFTGRRESNRDITEQKHQEVLIWQQANIDTLTGLANRDQFQACLEREIERTIRDKTTLAVLMIDLDGFKHINDTYGHTFGDRVIVVVAERIKSCIRKFDVAGRFGGDEFNVIITQLLYQKTIENVCKKILVEILRPIKIKGTSVQVGCSIGVSLFPNDENDPVKLIRDADLAMYSAKQAGRGTYRFFNTELQLKSSKRVSLHQDLVSAIENEYFELWYQPIFDVKTKQIVYAEALLRLNHPEKGYLPPIDFIPVAEETGLIIEIGNWVFERVIHDIGKNLLDPGTLKKIFINLSARQFHDVGRKFDWLHEQAKQLNFKPSMLCMEITERVILEPDETVTANLKKLRDYGFDIAIDDFGTGYSSLAYIQKYDAEYLKIDKSFIDKINEDHCGLALVEAIIAMAKKLDISVIAEGIEHAEQLSILSMSGCDFAQGFLLAKPMRLKELTSFMDAQKV